MTDYITIATIHYWPKWYHFWWQSLFCFFNVRGVEKGLTLIVDWEVSFSIVWEDLQRKPLNVPLSCLSLSLSSRICKMVRTLNNNPNQKKIIIISIKYQLILILLAFHLPVPKMYKYIELRENKFFKHFSLLIRGPEGFDSWKKCPKISWHCLLKI